MIDAQDFQHLAAEIQAPISTRAAEKLLAYLDAMLEQNQQINLTAVREREPAVMLHALDSVAMACCPFDTPPETALDIGTGNGFPGVAIACLFPEAKVVLMDRTLKKLRAIGKALEFAGFDLAKFELLHMDASEAGGLGHKDKYDLITARAVGPPHEMGRLSMPLLAEKGRMLAWLSDETEAPTTLKAGLRMVGEVYYKLPDPANRTRHLVDYAH